MPKEILREDETLRTIQQGDQEYVERKGTRDIAVIIALTDDRKLVLVNQFRPTLNQQVLELPAGKVDPQEQIIDAAKRELLEETGYEALAIQEVICGPVSPGISNEMLTLFYTDTVAKRHQGGGVDNENIRVHAVPLVDMDEFLAACRSNGILIDLKLFAGLYFLANLH